MVLPSWSAKVEANDSVEDGMFGRGEGVKLPSEDAEANNERQVMQGLTLNGAENDPA